MVDAFHCLGVEVHASVLVVDLRGGKTANGTNAQVFTSNNTAAQRFCLTPCVPATLASEGATVEDGLYEAPTAVRLEDGRWALFIDYYGAYGAEQGYVPFLSDDLKSGEFRRADTDFSFPYHFKHGTILTIMEEEYARLKDHDWTDPGFVEFFS